MKKKMIIVDGNGAAAHIAYKTNEICAIYPITPASPMGEFVDAWAAQGLKNLWGVVPNVVELQSEGGAAGTVHGALQGGSLTTTFTASQGLLLMIPNMYKIAGELNPTVFHIAARTIATHALSIFGDHSDVMATRQTGFAMLFGASVQEAMDMAMIAHSATLKSRIPFLNIFDGFRTSHEINKIEVVPDEVIAEMIDEDAIREFKNRCLNPKNPVIRGTAQNPDVFFQARESANEYYNNLPAIVKQQMELFKKLTGRSYHLFDYSGATDAERLVIIMGSGAGAVLETVETLVKTGEKVGVLNVHLYRPFAINDFIESIPNTVKKITVLDRTKEPGAIGDPLYQDVVNAYFEHGNANAIPIITGGRYGLSSKEFTPAMVAGIFKELKKEHPKNHFTIGIVDDVTGTSIDYDNTFEVESNTYNSMFFGLGSDGTVSANKNSIKIIGSTTKNYVQGYFVYDSKKAGSLTTSHLRFGKKPIRSTYLISQADFVACHQFNFLFDFDILKYAKKGATFLLNAPFSPDELWEQLPISVQQEIIDKELKFYAINATQVAKEAKLGSRLNTILQTCFFAISGILPKDEAIEKIKDAIKKSYAHKGDKIVQMNFKAVDMALDNLHLIKYNTSISGNKKRSKAVSDNAPDFVKEVLGVIMAGKGDELPVSAFPIDGTFPTATTQWEKRNIANTVPEWDAELCTQCNKCMFICPHAAIRAKVYPKSELEKAPDTLKYIVPIGKDFDKETEVYTLQVATEDCTGCDLCVSVCPAISKEKENYKAINMVDQMAIREVEQVNWDFFVNIPEMDRNRLKITNVKGSQFMQPLFEFSGACPGCGETPYLKLVTQLYGHNMLVANATGCSSIYGGNLPSTPWAKGNDGRGPAWSNSLFEDNAEFGLGIRLAANKKHEMAFSLLNELRTEIGDDLVNALIENNEKSEAAVQKQYGNITLLNKRLKSIKSKKARDLEFLSDNLVNKSVWIVGGDGWAYDIGYGGLDHVLASGEDVNILVLDTEVYSNTGGQNSKATPLAASAKFATSGKRRPKKNLAFQAISYGNVYVAQIAMGAKDLQTVKAITEANEFHGPSIIVAYSPCIEHGYDLGFGAIHQANAVKSGYWPLFRFNPNNPKGKRFKLDSKEASIPLKDYVYKESRYTRLVKQNPDIARMLLKEAENDVQHKWDTLKIMTAL